MKSKISILFFVILVLSLVFTPVYAQTSDEYPVYIIQSGDTLGGIADQFNVTVDDLIQLNNILDPNQLSPGMILKIPGLAGIQGVLTLVTLDLGESLHDLLVKYQLDENTIIRLNKISNINNLFAGSNLMIASNSDNSELSPYWIYDSNSTLLENSVRINANPQKILFQNQKSSLLDFYPNDVVFGIITDGRQPINLVSNSIDTLSIIPLPLKQGDTIVVHIKTFKQMSINGELNGHKLNFYSEDNVNYYALQGIHAMANPGLTDFSISALDGSKEIFSYQQSILLSPGNFETDDPLTVAPEMIDPIVTAPEMEKVESIISTFTPVKYWEGVFLSPDNDYGSEIPNYEQVKKITSFYGSRRIYNDNPEVTFHGGVDFGGGEGLPIVASAAGKVVFAGYMDVRGNATFIDHGLGVYSAYFHQSNILVKEGDTVEKGQVIGEVGNTGRVDRANEYEGAGSHLHWEIWVNGVQVNPFDWVNTDYPN